MDAPQFVFDLMESVPYRQGHVLGGCWSAVWGIYQVMRSYMDDRSMTVHTTDPEENEDHRQSTPHRATNLRDAIIYATEEIKKRR